MIQNLEYENLVDFLVYNSSGKFKTPEGILTGAQLLDKLWFKYAPKSGIQLGKLNSNDTAQKKLCSKRRVKLQDEGDVWYLVLENESGGWVEVGIRLA